MPNKEDLGRIYARYSTKLIDGADKVKVITGITVCPNCGASTNKAGLKRFLKRHPKLCTERGEFSRQLVQGTRSVEPDGNYGVVDDE